MDVRRPDFATGKTIKRHVWIDKQYQGPGPWEIPVDAITPAVRDVDGFLREFLTKEYGADFFNHHTLLTGNPESDSPRWEAWPGVQKPF